MFERLVGPIGDQTVNLEGMIAYAFYKRAKREAVVGHLSDHGARPTEDELAHLIRGFSTETQRHLFLAQAQRYLTAYATAAIESQRPGIEQASRETALLQEVRKQQRWWPQVLNGIVASALFALILYLLGLIVLAPSPQDFAQGTLSATPSPAPVDAMR